MVHTGKRRSILSEGGFTLMEMLIAFTLVAMMAVGLWSVFSISVRSWASGTESIDKTQRHRSILDKVRKQMASAYPLNAPMVVTIPGQPVSSSPFRPQQIRGANPIFTGTETGLRFVSLNSLRFHESPGLTIVSYEVALDPEGKYSLVEREARYTGQAMDQDVTMALSEAIPIFENLSSCVFEYFDPGNNDNTSQWIREWNGQERKQLPAAISLTMISRDSEGNSLNRNMVVPIQAQENDLGINPLDPRVARIRAVTR